MNHPYVCLRRVRGGTCTRRLRRGMWWTTSTSRESRKAVETQEHEKPEKRDGSSSSSITYHTIQSSTKTEAVLRYVDLPFGNQFMQLVTPSPNPGLEKLEKKDVMTGINPEGCYNNGKTVDKQVHKQPEKRDVMVAFAEKEWHEKPEKKDRMININPEGKYDMRRP
jgi:hypothetical protein